MLQLKSFSGIIISILLLGFGSSALAQSNFEYELLNHMASQTPNPDPEDRDGIKDQFKAHFIKSVYLENAFKSAHIFYSEDDGSSEYGLVNEMMLNHFAEYLSEMDFIDLSHVDL